MMTKTRIPQQLSIKITRLCARRPLENEVFTALHAHQLDKICETCKISENVLHLFQNRTQEVFLSQQFLKDMRIIGEQSAEFYFGLRNILLESWNRQLQF